MTTPQWLAIGVLVAMMALFLWGRFRYDVVAGIALAAAVAVGVVPARDAFKGFADDIVIIVASALVVSAAVARSGVMEAVMRRLSPYVRTTQAQVMLLVAATAILSAFIKNIGALAMLLPIAFQLAKRSGSQPALFLMPMAFAALLGGIVTLVGTSPNVIVARLRGELVGAPFGMFDFTPVGLGLALAGVAFLSFGYRLLPRDRKGTASLDQALDVKDYVTEARVRPEAPAAGMTVASLRALADDDVAVVGLLRRRRHGVAPLPDTVLEPDDVVLLQGEHAALDRLIADAGLELEGEDRPIAVHDPAHDIAAAEAVVGPESLLKGRTPGKLALHARYGVNLIAVSRSGERLRTRLRDIVLRPGDVVVIQGDEAHLPEALRELGCLPLAQRAIALGGVRRRVLALGILFVAILAVALGLVPVAPAFAGAALAFVLSGALSLRDAYDAVEWPILVMLGALIPVSDALRATGTTDVFASWLAGVGVLLPGWGAVALILVAAMAVTPFLNNAATVLIMAPIAAGFARGLGYQPDPFLMAVAIGAACDFLTPIGHQCNTLVMGPGGYRFGDYARLGAPLSLLVIVLGVPLVMLFWPLRG